MRSRFALTLVVLCLAVPVVLHGQSTEHEAGEDTVVVRNQLVAGDAADVRTGGHHKMHIIDLEAGKAYKISLEGTFRPHVRIESDDREVLADDTADETRKKAELTFVPVADGKYRIVVSARTAGETGAYSLSVSKGAGEAAVQFTGALAANDAFDRIRANCHHKVFMHKMFAGRSYTIDLMGQFDTYLRIEDAAGQNLAQDDDGGDGLNSRLVFRPVRNDIYRVIATSCGPNTVGPFTLKIQPNSPEKLVLNVQAQLAQNDPLDRVRKGSHCKTYAVKMDAGSSYVIDLQSNMFDSYLRLEDPAGNSVAQDDDGGGNLNSRITYRPNQPGTYRVIATSLGAGSVGDFTLTVRQN